MYRVKLVESTRYPWMDGFQTITITCNNEKEVTDWVKRNAELGKITVEEIPEKTS